MVTVAAPVSSDVADYVDYTGRTDAVESVDVRARVSGYLTEIKFKGGVFDFTAKYTPGHAEHLLPAPVPAAVAEEAKRMALAAHRAIGCSGISRSDFRYDDRKPGTEGLYFLEINTQPGFTPISLVPEQAQHEGISFGALCKWLVEEARCHA